MRQSTAAPMRPPGGRRTAGRAQQDHLLDPYRPTEKLHDGTVCRQCGAVYEDGRWSWAPRPPQAHETVCSACRRITERAPAGNVLLRGDFGGGRKDEVLGLVRHQEQAEKREHPQNRIMGIAEDADGILVTTTDIHLPRRIGEALRRAFHGDLEMHFDDAAYFARVVWSPPA